MMLGFTVCAGQSAGCKAAVHAMNEMYQEEDTDDILLVDASNAFNNFIWKTLLHNINMICSNISMYVRNCYHLGAHLFVVGVAQIHSNEGTTQVNQTSMGIYTIGLTLLFTCLSYINKTCSFC